jgi:hypothetical protein
MTGSSPFTLILMIGYWVFGEKLTNYVLIRANSIYTVKLPNSVEIKSQKCMEQNQPPGKPREQFLFHEFYCSIHSQPPVGKFIALCGPKSGRRCLTLHQESY